MPYRSQVYDAGPRAQEVEVGQASQLAHPRTRPADVGDVSAMGDQRYDGRGIHTLPARCPSPPVPAPFSTRPAPERAAPSPKPIMSSEILGE
jgi:hypothetical protein